MKKTRRKAFSITETLIMMVAAAFFIVSIYAGIDIIINALNYSKKVMYKLYTRKEIDMTHELMSYEIKRTGSLGPVIMGLDDFYNNSVISTGDEKKGVFALSDNEFIIQYGVSYPYALLKTESVDVYEKIIKDKELPATVNINNSGFWPTVISNKDFGSPEIFLLPEASITAGHSKVSTTVEISGAPDRIFFLYRPDPNTSSSKQFEIDGEAIYGQRLHTIKFLYSQESTEDASSLKMVKFFPFADKTATSVLLRDLVDFDVKYWNGFSSSDPEYFTDFNWNNSVRTINISFITEIPEVDATLTSTKILWIP